MISTGSVISTKLTAHTCEKTSPEEVVISDLWNEQPVVLRLFRRFGCPLTRYEAKVMSDYKPEFDRLGVKMIAIGFDEVGLEEWQLGKFWKGDFYMDPEKKVYNFFEIKRLLLKKGLVRFFNSGFRDHIKDAKKNLGGNFTKGDGFVMGGTYVIDKDGKVLYAFNQTNADKYPSMRKIIEAVGGDPAVVKDEDEFGSSRPKSCKSPKQK